MENSTDETSKELRKSYEIKINNALNSLFANFVPFAQTLLIGAGYSILERRVFHPCFIRFFHLSLIVAAAKLHERKTELSQELNIEERRFVALLINQNSFAELDFKMAYALHLFESRFPLAIENLMSNAHFTESESQQGHLCYTYFFAIAFSSLTNMFVRLRSVSVCCLRARMEKDSDFEEQLTSDSSVKLMAVTKRFLIYCVFTSKRKLTLKVCKSEFSPLRDIERLDLEFKVSKILSHNTFRKSLKRTNYQNKSALVFEWAHGSPLSELKKLSLEEFLGIASEIVRSIVAYHDSRIMHLNLTSDHIILNEEKKTIKIIGFGSSSNFHCNLNYISKEEWMERDVRFISPEQSGFVMKDVDYRSDFYSLGIIFYKLLTGSYPFEIKDTLKLIHMHILEKPKTIKEIIPTIPSVVSEMVSKLLQKEAEARYQSAKGLLLDLDWMSSEYINDSKLTSVVLSHRDRPPCFILPQQLYVRTSEIKTLRKVFDNLRATSFEVVLVSGDSGTGKTRLTHELFKPTIENHGIFLHGRFDKDEDEPYIAIIEAIVGFCDELLISDKTTMNKFKARFEDAVGDEGKVLTDLIHNLHLIIGEQPEITNVFGGEARNRLNYVLLKLFNVFCSTEWPFVLVLHNMQWLDIDSLEFLSALLLDRSMKNFMFVCTYRERGISSEQPFSEFLKLTKKSDLNVTDIELKNLDLETVNSIISDALHISSIESYSLTAQVYRKTKGNPSFIVSLLNSLQERGLLFFCTETMSWKWDSCKNDDSANIEDLSRMKVLSLRKHARVGLKVASCLGSRITESSLRQVLKSKKVYEALMASGLIVKIRGNGNLFRFSHELIQKASFSLLPKDLKSVYLYIANKLWESYSKEELNENIYTLASLLCNAIDMIKDDGKKLKVAELLALAGEKAMSKTAFHKASKYFKQGIKLLHKNCWKTNNELSCRLFEQSSKAAYSIANFVTMNQYIDEVLKNTSSTLQLVQSFCLKIRYHNDSRSFEKAIQVGFCLLDKIDGNINLYQYDEALISSEMEKMRDLLLGDTEGILKMKEMTDEKSLAIMLIFTELLYSSFFFNPRLFSLITLRMVQLTNERGISKYASCAFSGFARFFCVKNEKNGFHLGKLAFKLLNKFKSKELLPKVYNLFYMLVGPFFESVHNSLDQLLRAYRIGLEAGANSDSYISAYVYFGFSFVSGKSLKTLIEEIEEFKRIHRSQANSSLFLLTVQQAVINLTCVKIENPSILKGIVFDYSMLHEENTKQYDAARPFIICGIVAYLFYDYNSAQKFFQRCRWIENVFINTVMYPIFIFYESLTSLALAKTKTDNSFLIDNAKSGVRKLRVYAENAPENFLNKVYLLEAELSVLNNEALQARENFEKAISLCESHGFMNEKALAYERAGIFFLDYDFSNATKFILRSYHSYKSWDATRKLDHLTAKYSSMFEGENFSSYDFKTSLTSDLEAETTSLPGVSLASNEIASIRSGSSDSSKRRRIT